MKVPFVDLKVQYESIKPEIDAAIQDVLSNTAFVGGSRVKEFEDNFAALYGVKHCISTANGTDSIYIILKMLGIGAGDEVITSAHTWISTSETISQTGATPVFADTEPGYFTISPSAIKQKITAKTKAIIPVHLCGQMCDMNEIMALAKAHNLYVVEDCAQSHFSEYKGVRAGLMGIAGSFSFYPGKNLGAYGDAGCVITNDDELALNMRMYKNHGALVKHEHKMEGINSRLDGIQAAILNVKLNHILNWTDKRIAAAALYTTLLSEVPEITTPIVRNDTKHSFHLYMIKTPKRDELKAYLAEHEVATGLHYPKILPILEAYSRQQDDPSQFKDALSNQDEILSLPMYPELSTEQIHYLVDIIKRFFQNKT